MAWFDYVGNRFSWRRCHGSDVPGATIVALPGNRSELLLSSTTLQGGQGPRWHPNSGGHSRRHIALFMIAVPRNHCCFSIISLRCFAVNRDARDSVKSQGGDLPSAIPSSPVLRNTIVPKIRMFTAVKHEPLLSALLHRKFQMENPTKQLYVIVHCSVELCGAAFPGDHSAPLSPFPFPGLPKFFRA